MKRTYLLYSFLLVFFYTYSSAQCGLPGDIYLNTQQEVDDFLTNYPGITEIDGNLYIWESAFENITDLSGLSHLERVRGCLFILGNDNLTSLTGLENLYYVGRDVNIWGNDVLVNLNGLNNLNAVRQSFSVSNNDSLQDLTGGESINDVGYLRIRGNSNLTSLNGLSNLKTIRNLLIENNDMLPDLTGLESVEVVEDRIFIRDNSVLSSLSGLDDLFSLAAYRIWIQNNPNLSTCGITSMCRYAYDGHNMHLSNNAAGCNSKTEILDNCTVPFYPCLPDGITFTSQEQIDNFKINHPDCRDIGGDMVINSTTVTDTDGLDGVVSIDGNLIIQDNPSLTTMKKLNLVRINGELKIEDNLVLWNINGLAYVNSDSMSNLVVHDNPQLGYPCAIRSFCIYIYGDGPHSFSNNAGGCQSEYDLMIGCSLPITLTSFTANIRNKTAVLNWQTATETNNSGFEIQKSKDGINWEKTGWQAGQGNTTATQSYTYTDENPFFGVSYYRLKQVDFSGNFEFTDAVSVEYKGKSTISLYPNPAEDILYIADLDGQNIQEINLYNQAGQAIQLDMKNFNSIDTSQLLPGIYMLKIMVNEEVFFEKFVVK